MTKYLIHFLCSDRNPTEQAILIKVDIKDHNGYENNEMGGFMYWQEEYEQHIVMIKQSILKSSRH